MPAFPVLRFALAGTIVVMVLAGQAFAQARIAPGQGAASPQLGVVDTADRLFEVIDSIAANYVDLREVSSLAALAVDGAARQKGRVPGEKLARLITRIAASGDRAAARAGVIEALTLARNRFSSEMLIAPLLAQLGEQNQFVADRVATPTTAVGGIGLELQKRKGAVFVVSTFDGRPAARVGVQAGDEIESLGVETDRPEYWRTYPVASMPLPDIINVLRGPIGTKVRLVVRRFDPPQRQTFHVVREYVAPNSVTMTMVSHNIGYIRLMTFGSDSTSLVTQSVAAMLEAKGSLLEGVVLDLRSNGGGLLEEIVKVADLFLDKGRIMRLSGRNADNNRIVDATPGDILDNRPLVVLINENTASGAELMTLALQKNGRARVVGSRSAGNAIISTVFPLRGRNAIKIQTGRWFGPDDLSWEKVGVIPDIPVGSVDRQPGQDGELLRAFNVIKLGR
jgi:C-terminal peptidase prc